MPIITAKILDSRCKSCGYNTVAWWKASIARNRLCISCHKEIQRQKQAKKPPSARERARRADLALYETFGSEQLTLEFALSVTPENSPKVKSKAAQRIFHCAFHEVRYPDVIADEVLEKLAAKEKRGAIKQQIIRLDQRPRRINLNRNRNEILTASQI